MISSALVATPMEKHCRFKMSLNCVRLAHKHIHKELVSNTEIVCSLYLFEYKGFGFWCSKYINQLDH